MSHDDLPNILAFDPPDASERAATLQETESDLIATTLAWCARRFGAQAARFLRPTEHAGWQVITWMDETVSSHPADQAEIAMAWMVALGSSRLLVGKPRVSGVEGNGIRPISTRQYLGIPATCQDRLIGIVEVAGDLRTDIDTAALAAHDEISRFALRLAFDRSLRPAAELTAESVITLGPGNVNGDKVTLEPSEFRFVSMVNGTASIAEIVALTGISIDDALQLAQRLERRGLIEVVC